MGLIGRLKRSIDKFEDKNFSNKKGSLITKDEKNKIKGKPGNKNKNSLKNKSSKSINEHNNNITNNKNSLKEKKESKKIDKNIIMKNLEKNWKKEENLIDKAPLLITAMKDLEFIPKELIILLNFIIYKFLKILKCILYDNNFINKVFCCSFSLISSSSSFLFSSITPAL